MMKEKVILTKLPITQAGQIAHLQVKIPRDALRIIGMEASAMYMNMQAGGAQPIGFVGPIQHPLISGFPLGRRNIFQINADLFLGDVRLQSCEDTNVFYAEDIYFTDENLAFGDFSATHPGFIPAPQTHGYKREECTVNTNGDTTILKGIYRDRQAGTGGISPNTPPQTFFQYVASIYVWYEKKC